MENKLENLGERLFGGDFMKRNSFLFVLIVALVFLLSGCVDFLSGSFSGGKTGSINGKIITHERDPIKGATVSVAEKTSTTNQEGLFQIEELKVGEYIVVISHEEYATKTLELYVEESSNSLGKIKLTKAEGDSQIELSDISPEVTILKFNQNRWQMIFAVYEPGEIEISEESRIVTPKGETLNLQNPHTNRWSIWWNISSINSGEYIFDIKFKNGTNKSFSVNIENEDFEIELPTLISPENGGIIGTLNPIFKFELPKEPEGNRLRIGKKEASTSEDEWILLPTDEYKFTLTDEFELEEGKQYKWTVQPAYSSFYRGQILISKRAKAPYFYFTVEDLD